MYKLALVNAHFYVHTRVCRYKEMKAAEAAAAGERKREDAARLKAYEELDAQREEMMETDRKAMTKLKDDLLTRVAACEGATATSADTIRDEVADQIERFEVEIKVGSPLFNQNI